MVGQAAPLTEGRRQKGQGVEGGQGSSNSGKGQGAGQERIKSPRIVSRGREGGGGWSGIGSRT